MSAVPRLTATLSTLALLPLMAWNLTPASFPGHAHDFLAAVPLAGVGVACLLQPVLQRAPRADLVKAIVGATAFLAWAGNQLWPDCARALLMNDAAVALFVVDVLLGVRAASATHS